MRRKLLGSILVRDGVLTEEQLSEAVHHQQEYGTRLGESLLALGLCTEVPIKRALAEQIEMPFVDLEAQLPHPRTLQILPRRLAVDWGVVPISVDEGRLTVVARNPFDFRIDEVIRKAVGMPVTIACGVEGQIEQVLRRYDDLKAWQEAGIAREGWGERTPRLGAAPDLLRASEAPAIAGAVETLLQDVVRRRASEVQFEATAEGLSVQARVNGRTTQLASFSRLQIRPVLARMKTLARLDIRDQTRPQEGTLEVLAGDRLFQYRARTQPQPGGECLSLDLPAQTREDRALQELHFCDAHQSALRTVLGEPHGLFLVGGTTQASVMQTAAGLGGVLDPPARKVITLSYHTPLELPGGENLVSTCGRGGSPAEAVQRALDRSPAALILTHIPDAATLAAAVAAAEHCLVVAALRTPNLLGTLLRCAEETLAASRLLGALTVLPMLRVCDACSIQYEPEAEVLEALTSEGATGFAGGFRRGRGCENCRHRGTRGRILAYELFTAGELHALLQCGGAQPADLLSREHRTTRDDASWKARAGWITPEHVSLLPSAEILTFEDPR